MNDEPSPVIEAVLSKLKHLDLSDRLSNVRPELVFRGGYGDVFVGTVIRKDGGGEMKVSMKQLRVTLCNEDFAKSFAKEITIWARLKHRNIVRLEGFIREGSFPTLVSVWASKGSLRSYINGRKEYDSMQMATGIAEGLAYLHSLDIVHSDLKSDNVLVDDSDQPMICDFGISRMLSYSQTILASTSYETLKGSARWMAYELFLLDERSMSRTSIAISVYDEATDDIIMPMHTKATDMWAFGMVIYEIISRKLPFSNIRGDLNVMTVIRNKQLPKKPKEIQPIEEELWKLCTLCWNHHPDERLAIEDAISTLAHNSKTRHTQHSYLSSGSFRPSEMKHSNPLSGLENESPPKLSSPRISYIPPPPPRSPYRPTSSKNVASDSSTINTYLKKQDIIATPGMNKLKLPPEQVESPTPSSVLPQQLVLASQPSKPTAFSESSFGELSLLNDKPLPIIPSDDSSLDSPADTITLENLDDAFETSTLTVLAASLPMMTKREHALKELLTSERAYASDLAFIRDVHIPMALGDSNTLRSPNPMSPSIPSGSSSSSYLEPPMTKEDVRVIFGNITDLAAFSDFFSERLQDALGGVLEDSKGDDWVGALFLEMIPRMEEPYKTYITRHPNAFSYLAELPQTPALTSYLAQTHNTASSVIHAWDLQSLLVKPVQRLLSYTSFLITITENTADSHPDKANLRKARDRMEEVAVAVNECRRRNELITGILNGNINVEKSGALTKILPFSKYPQFSASRMKSTGAALLTDQLESGDKERQLVETYEMELRKYNAFIRTLAGDVVHWAEMVRGSLEHLKEWAKDFGKAIGINDEQTSEAFDIFFSIINLQLIPQCQNPLDIIGQDLLLQLGVLLDTTKAPQRLLSAMHAFEPMHRSLLSMNFTESKPSTTILEASQNYVALRGQLASDLPKYLRFLDRGLVVCILHLARRQTDYWSSAGNQWNALWDSLRVEGENKTGSEGTVAIWRDRFSDVEKFIDNFGIMRRDSELQRAARFKARGHTSKSDISNSRVAALSTESLTSILGGRSQSEVLQSFKPRGFKLRQKISDTLRAVLRRSEFPAQKRVPSIHSDWRLNEATSTDWPDYRPLFAAARSDPGKVPSRPAQRLDNQLVKDYSNSSSGYQVVVIHDCSPPKHATYKGLPFLQLRKDQIYTVLRELGNPSAISDLDILVVEGEDCLLVVRASGGEVGLALASFMFPTDN